MTAGFHTCAIIPTFDNPQTIRRVVEAVRELVPEVIVIDDGSGPEGRQQVARLGQDKLAQVVHRRENGGKGAAVKTGLLEARRLGFTHAMQIDADGQHDLADVFRFLEAAEKSPASLVLGQPLFDASAPAGRRFGRKITVFWTTLEIGSRAIVDPMCGFSNYPNDAAIAASVGTGDHMDFDIEIAVRLAWSGVPIINLPTRVRYPRADEGGVSHFHMLWDNLRISWMHTRLVILAILRLLWWPIRRLRA